ncbi:MAG: hypothetical protein KY453_12025 [Gemmatimonadetes bacterium]|nr:hypothetical protein [Gemmatimonadota bacterium]
MTGPLEGGGESREFDPDQYAEAIAYLEALAEAGVKRVIIERFGHGGWKPLFAGPPSMGVYGLARLQETPAPPRIRAGPAQGAMNPPLMLV